MSYEAALSKVINKNKTTDNNHSIILSMFKCQCDLAYSVASNDLSNMRVNFHELVAHSVDYEIDKGIKTVTNNVSNVVVDPIMAVCVMGKSLSEMYNMELSQEATPSNDRFKRELGTWFNNLASLAIHYKLDWRK